MPLCQPRRLALGVSRVRSATCAGLGHRRQENQPAGSHRSIAARASADELGPSSPADRRRLWMAAIKPPMYSVGFMPVLVSAAAVYAEVGALPWRTCLGLFTGAVLIIAWLNLSNDAFDAETGVDVCKPESVVNLTGNRRGVLAAALAFFAAGASLLWRLTAAANDPRIKWMLAGAIACGYVYQGPQFRFSYKGLGEPLCFGAFSAATLAFYLAQHPAASLAATAPQAAVALSPAIAVLAVAQGITITAILFCSHFHQVAGDVAAGKMSPIVRMGTEAGCRVLSVATVLPYVVVAGGCAVGALPAAVLLASALSLPAAAYMVRFAWDNHTVAAAVAPLKRYAVKWHMALGAALCLGLLASRRLTTVTLAV